MEYEEVESRIGYTFKDKELLRTALTHTSYANMHDVPSNEKLEFLGDSILEFITSRYLYQTFKKLNEGSMTKVRATVVCEESLYSVAMKLELGHYLITSKGEGYGNVRKKAILADAIEAIIAAIYLDSDDIEQAAKFILDNLKDAMNDATKHVGVKDYKTVLQERLQRNGNVKIKYIIIDEEGPDHNKRFAAEVLCDRTILAKGCGKSKKTAEMDAAKNALEAMDKKRRKELIEAIESEKELKEADYDEETGN